MPIQKEKIIELKSLDIYELHYFNEIMKHIFKGRTEIEEYNFKKKKYYIYYKFYDLYKLECLKDENINDLKKCYITISFNCNTFNNLIITAILYNDKYDDVFKRVLKKIYIYLSEIKEKIRSNKYIDNYFLECFQLSNGKFSGYYDFENVKLDFGFKQKTYRYPIVVKTKMKYKIIINEELNMVDFMIDTLKIDRYITLILIQLFLRTNFEIITNGVYYNNNDADFLHNLETSISGELIKNNRTEIIEFQNDKVDSEIDLLFNYFNNLDYKDKSVFLQSAEAYLEGLKDNNGKEIMFFIISLETLANYEYNLPTKKEEKIIKLIRDLYGKDIINPNYIIHIYELRSVYTHQGVSNNKLKHRIFNILENNERIIFDVEKIAYSVLLKWLICKGEMYVK